MFFAGACCCAEDAALSLYLRAPALPLRRSSVPADATTVAGRPVQVFTSCYYCNAISAAESIAFRRLLPPGPPAGVHEVVLGFGLHERSGRVGRASAEAPAVARDRPYVVLNMIATLDGRATIAGRSGPLSSPADRALFHGLRSVVDAVLAGAGTVRAERYGPLVRDPDGRRARSKLGLSESPLACIVSASLDFPADQPLLADPGSRVAILTPSDGDLAAASAQPEGKPRAGAGAQIDYVRARAPDGSLDLRAALAELHDRLHVGTLLCEGGPHLNAELLAGGLVDELFLSVSPLLAGGDPAGDDPALRIVSGPGLDPPARLELAGALERDSSLFLRYRVRDGG